PARITSAVTRVRGPVGRDHGLELVPHGEQLVLGHDVLAAALHVIGVMARLDDSVDRTGFLAESTVDALEEVDVVARRASRAIVAAIRLDRDRERRTHSLAQLAGDAALLAVRVAAQGVQAAEARRLRRLLLGKADREGGPE